jgi:Putative transposase
VNALSLPGALRWPVVKDASLLRAVEKALVRSVFRWQRARARGLGAGGKLRCGAVCFAQMFGSALQLTPHLHVLVPEGVFGDEGFVALPPPSQEDVEAVLVRAVTRLLPLFEDRQPPWPEDDFEVLQAQGAQLRLLPPEEPRPGRKGRLAVAHGLSLHADTWVHGNDRQGLATLCRYGARGPIAESRLTRRADGRYAYETKKGVTLVMTAEQLVRRLVWLIPPRGLHLTNFHGVFASHSAVRHRVLLPRAAPVDAPPQAAGATDAAQKRRPRVDWAALQRHTFGCDVWQCPCGGRRAVVAVVTRPSTAEVLLKRLGQWPAAPPRPVATGPPQRELVLEP